MGRVKGTLIVKPVKVLRAHRKAAFKALPVPLHHYLNSTILYSNWYDEADYLAICQACAEVLSSFDADPWELMGRVSAKVDLEEIYSAQMRPGNPAASLKHFEKVWRLHHDTGKVVVTIEGAGKATVELADYATVSRDMCKSIGGHIWGTLDLSGAKDIQRTKTRCRAADDEVCRWNLEWRDGAR